MRRQAKREVAVARREVYEDLYDRLEIREGEKELYRLTKQETGKIYNRLG